MWRGRRAHEQQAGTGTAASRDRDERTHLQRPAGIYWSLGGLQSYQEIAPSCSAGWDSSLSLSGAVYSRVLFSLSYITSSRSAATATATVTGRPVRRERPGQRGNARCVR